MISYVLGFMFSPAKTRVALIRKNKPEWQAGKLNGIGGKIEANETRYDAMVREFKEETGVEVHGWQRFCEMSGRDAFSVSCFCAIEHLSALRTVEEEEVVIIGTGELALHAHVENLDWLIPLALDHLQDGRPAFTTVTYE